MNKCEIYKKYFDEMWNILKQAGKNETVILKPSYLVKIMIKYAKQIKELNPQ
ncbi:MAG: hypothetical protein KAR08_01505 [Candidatus Heimdallarchaeota archaeon]|nr:hypothetical protein [Candidatus Heimdallarchaeota archaeon]